MSAVARVCTDADEAWSVYESLKAAAAKAGPLERKRAVQRRNEAMRIAMSLSCQSVSRISATFRVVAR